MDRTALIAIGIAIAVLAALAIAAPRTAVTELAPDWPWLLALGTLVPVALVATPFARIRDACLTALQPRNRGDSSSARPSTLPPTIALLILTAVAVILGPAPAVAPALLAALLATLALMSRAAGACRLNQGGDLVDGSESGVATPDAPRARRAA